MSGRPKRWRDLPEDDRPESRAGMLFRSARACEASPDLEHHVQASLRRDRTHPLRRLSLAAVFTLILTAGGIVSAAMLVERAWRASSAANVPASAFAQTLADKPSPNAEPEPETKPETETDPLAAEATILSAALDALAADDPPRALTHVAIYEAKHAHGALAKEIFRTKVSALVASGHHDRARRLLVAEDLHTHPRAAELFVLRGELRVRAGECASAAEDFRSARTSADPNLIARVRAATDACPDHH